ncbi:hypothetical protein GN156_29430, partial [bacterium LRH843]|nr:hypothetical protein [bacterium LRH843]
DNGDGILVMDKDGNGKIDNLSEVFSENFDPRAKTALEALRLLDSNYDGVFDASDDAFHQVRLWVDSNVDGITDDGELKALDDASINITSI